VYKERDEFKKEKKSFKKGGKYKSAFIRKSIEDAEVIIAKQNAGSTRTINIRFNRELVEFKDKDKDEDILFIIKS